MAGDVFEEIEFYPWAMVPDKSAPPTAGTRKATTVQSAHYDHWTFPDVGGGSSPDSSLYFHWMVPEDIDTSTVPIMRMYWESPSTTSSLTASMSVAGVCLGTGDDLDASMSTADSMGSDPVQTGGARYLSIGNNITLTNSTASMTAGELQFFRITRDISADNLTDNFNLIKVVIQFKRLRANNAQWSSGTAPDEGKEYREKLFYASSFVADKTVAPAFGTRQETTLQSAHYDFLAYDDGALVTDPSAYVYWKIPEDFDNTNGTFRVRLYWEATATTNNTFWGIFLYPFTNNEDLDTGAFTASLEGTAGPNGTSRRLEVSFNTGINTSTLNAGELLCIQIWRNSDNAGDSMAGDARLIGLGIQWLSDETLNAKWA